MAATSPVLIQSGEAIARLSDLITALIQSESVTVAERDQAKADLAALLISSQAKEAANAEEKAANEAAAQANLDKLNQLVEIAAAATAAPVVVPPVVEPVDVPVAPVDEPAAPVDAIDEEIDMIDPEVVSESDAELEGEA